MNFLHLTAVVPVEHGWSGKELIDTLSSGSMPDLCTTVGGEYGAVDLQQTPLGLPFPSQ